MIGVRDGKGVGDIGGSFHDVHDDAAYRQRENCRQQRNFRGDSEDIDRPDVLGGIERGLLRPYANEHGQCQYCERTDERNQWQLPQNLDFKSGRHAPPVELPEPVHSIYVTGLASAAPRC